MNIMKLELHMLKRQRQLVKQHLDWLDSIIAAQESDSSTENLPVAEKMPEPTALPVEMPETAATEALADFSDIPLQDYKSTSASQTKLGCIVATVLLVALFLFALFGLPYMFDWGAEDADGTEEGDSPPAEVVNPGKKPESVPSP